MIHDHGGGQQAATCRRLSYAASSPLRSRSQKTAAKRRFSARLPAVLRNAVCTWEPKGQPLAARQPDATRASAIGGRRKSSAAAHSTPPAAKVNPNKEPSPAKLLSPVMPSLALTNPSDGIPSSPVASTAGGEGVASKPTKLGGGVHGNKRFFTPATVADAPHILNEIDACGTYQKKLSYAERLANLERLPDGSYAEKELGNETSRRNAVRRQSVQKNAASMAAEMHERRTSLQSKPLERAAPAASKVQIAPSAAIEEIEMPEDMSDLSKGPFTVLLEEKDVSGGAVVGSPRPPSGRPSGVAGGRRGASVKQLPVDGSELPAERSRDDVCLPSE